jgi:hypothetical protein
MATVTKNHLLLKIVYAPELICPLCQNKGKVEMSFYQLQLESEWVRNTKKITATAYCDQCGQDIPTVRWNKDLDSFYNATKQQIEVVSSFKIRKIGIGGKILIWLFIIFFGAMILFLAGLYIYHHTK